VSGLGDGSDWRQLVFGKAHALGQSDTEPVEQRGLGGIGLGDATQPDLTMGAVGSPSSSQCYSGALEPTLYRCRRPPSYSHNPRVATRAAAFGAACNVTQPLAPPRGL